MQNQPLKGLKIIDMTTYAAGPAAGRILADWGAEVIKVEGPAGDPGRWGGLQMGLPVSDEENPTYTFTGCNKRVITLNTKDPAGMEIMHQLLSQSDGFISSVRTKALRKLGLDYESLSVKYPKLVWGQLNGFGDLGPDADNAGFDMVAYWAKSGAMLDLADEAAGVPLCGVIAYGDNCTGMSLAGGMAAAFFQRSQTGRGDKVMVSLYSQGLWNEGHVITASQYGDKYPKSRKYPSQPLSNSYKCADGKWIFICGIEYDKAFPKVMKMIGREDLMDNEKYNNLKAAKKNGSELVPVLDIGFSKFDRDTWCKMLREADIAHDKINDFIDTVTDAQAIANGYIYQHTLPNGKIVSYPAGPVQFGVQEPPVHAQAGAAGQHTVEIMHEFGFSNEAIEKYLNAGIITQHA